MKPTIDRRDFVKAGLAAAAGAAASRPLLAGAAPATKSISLPDGIPARALGTTGHELPVFGHGGSAMVQLTGKYLGVDMLPTEQRVAMVRRGYDAGVRYFDTARIYKDSENIIGEALEDVRDDVYIATKVTVPMASQARPSIEQSLEALRTSYVDCLQLHGPVYQRMGYDTAMEIVEEIQSFKDEGMCRFVGLTGHGGFDTMLRFLRTGAFDQLLIAYGYFARAYDTRISSASLAQRDVCLAEAHSRGMGLVAMKVLGASFLGHRSEEVAPDLTDQERRDLIRAAIRWVLQDERISVLALGITLPSDTDQDAEIFRGDLDLTADDRALLAKFSAQAYGSEIVREMKIT
jgi:aryl-alcohol dehydrogenase-like predicted oxidoreductase